jgi:hypothetical protein
MYWTEIAAISKAITLVITNEPFLPKTRYIGSMNRRISHTITNVNDTESNVANIPKD